MGNKRHEQSVPEYHIPVNQKQLRLNLTEYPELGPIKDKVVDLLGQLIGLAYSPECYPANDNSLLCTEFINVADLETIAEEVVGNWGLSKLLGEVALNRSLSLRVIHYSSGRRGDMAFAVRWNKALGTGAHLQEFEQRANALIKELGFELNQVRVGEQKLPGYIQHMLGRM